MDLQGSHEVVERRRRALPVLLGWGRSLLHCFCDRHCVDRGDAANLVRMTRLVRARHSIITTVHGTASFTARSTGKRPAPHAPLITAVTGNMAVWLTHVIAQVAASSWAWYFLGEARAELPHRRSAAPSWCVLSNCKGKPPTRQRACVSKRAWCSVARSIEPHRAGVRAEFGRCAGPSQCARVS